MIYLTGDVHSKLNSWEQKTVGNELDAAEKYLEILEKYTVSCTLFLNGICLEKESEKIKKLLKYDVEIGGHTYNNFGNLNLFSGYIYRKLYGCIYGPSFYQKKDINRTKKTFSKLGIKMESWRTHSFGSNEKTMEILRNIGVKYVSDLVGEIKPFEKNGITHLPINIPVDVNTISYGETRPESKNPFASCTKGRIEPEEWFEIVKKRVTENEKKGIPSILLLHPATMAAIDNFVLFERIAKFLSKFKSKKISEF